MDIVNEMLKNCKFYIFDKDHVKFKKIFYLENDDSSSYSYY